MKRNRRPVSKPPKRGRPPVGAALTAAERMRRLRARRKAAGFRAVTSWVSTSHSPYSSHRLLEARSLAIHALIAQKIERNRALLAIPRRNLERWSQRWGNEAPAWLKEWRRILHWKWADIAALITEPSETAARLRQSSPFPGVLSAAERERIYAAFRA